MVPSLKEPKPATLKRYGLTLDAWKVIAEGQGFTCAVCGLLPRSGRLCIDHFHAPKWKHMPPGERVKYVRGLLCWRCNATYLGRGITIERSRNVTTYLERFAAANDNGAPPIDAWLPK